MIRDVAGAPVGAVEVVERRAPGAVPLWCNPDWEERFGWLVQGTTGSGDAEEPFDLGLSGGQTVGRVLERWRSLIEATGLPCAVHARQVHGSDLWVHTSVPAPGLLLMTGVDGHLTRVAGILLTVSVADCVPVFLVDEQRRGATLLHAGWRGAAQGILERAVAIMAEEYGSTLADLWLHCGPAICGPCYPVGAEVHRAVLPEKLPPGSGQPLDLRAVLVERATRIGVDPARCSVSSHCTPCGGGQPDAPRTLPFFSHRGGDTARQMAVLGLRP